MKKNHLNLLPLLCLVLVIGISCSKNDIPTKTEQSKEKGQNKDVLDLIHSGTSAPLNFTPTHSTKTTDKEKPFSSSATKQKKSINNSTNSRMAMTCQSLGYGDYGGQGYYMYPATDMNFDGVGSLIHVNLSAFDAQNRFSIFSPTNQLVAQSDWIGSETGGATSGVLQFTVMEPGTYTLYVETQTTVTSDYWEVQYYCAKSGISINGNRFKFRSIADYEQFAEGSLDQSELTTMANNNPSLSTLEETDNGDLDDLYPDFIMQIINQDHIVELSSFLIKFDLENNRVLAIKSSEANAYSNLVHNQLTASGMMNFNLDVSNGIEILQAIENGTLQVSNYQSTIEVSDPSIGFQPMKTDGMLESESYAFQRTGKGGVSLSNFLFPATKYTADYFGCRHASAHTDQDAGSNGHVWDTRTGTTRCGDNLRPYWIEPKLKYQKVVFYFSLLSRMESWMIPTCFSSPSTDDRYLAHLKVTGYARLIKRCGSEQLITAGTNGVATDSWKLKWRPWQSSRSLQRYDFSVHFHTSHFDNSGTWVTSREYRIVDGY